MQLLDLIDGANGESAVVGQGQAAMREGGMGREREKKRGFC